MIAIINTYNKFRYFTIHCNLIYSNGFNDNYIYSTYEEHKNFRTFPFLDQIVDSITINEDFIREENYNQDINHKVIYFINKEDAINKMNTINLNRQTLVTGQMLYYINSHYRIEHKDYIIRY